MEVTSEERQLLITETAAAAKADVIKETKSDMETINKLISDQRKAYDLLLEGKLTKADYEEYEKKSREFEQKLEKKVKDKLDEYETKMNRLPVETPGRAPISPEAMEYKTAYFGFMRNGGKLALSESAQKYAMETKALVSDATGQILIPEQLESEIYRALPTITVIRPEATVRTLTKGDRIRRRSMDEVEMGWGKLELGAEPVESELTPEETYQYIEDLEGLMKVGKDQLEDTDISLEAYIVDSYSRKKGETEETAFVNGTGHGNEQPEGMLTGTTLSRVITTAADAIVTDDILNLIYAVPAQYRRNGKLMFPSTTILAMRKLKSGGAEALYLWQPNVQAGEPSTFAGYPVLAQEDIPAIGSSGSADIGIFGDIRAGYRIVDRKGLTVQRLTELYALAGLVGFLVSARLTGGVIRADALRVLQELP